MSNVYKERKRSMKADLLKESRDLRKIYWITLKMCWENIIISWFAGRIPDLTLLILLNRSTLLPSLPQTNRLVAADVDSWDVGVNIRLQKGVKGGKIIMGTLITDKNVSMIVFSFFDIAKKVRFS